MKNAINRITACVALTCLVLVPTASYGQAQSTPDLAAKAEAQSQGQTKVTLIVKMAPGLSQAQKQAVFDRNGAKLERQIDKLNLHIITVAAPAAEAITSNLKKEAGVLRVEASSNRRLQGLPNDTMVGSQWALPQIAWDQVYGTNYPVALASVAILDTGVDTTHPDLINSLLPGTSLIDSSNGATDENGHGTWLAGIVAARTNNLTGIAGVAYDKVQVMPVKVIGADGLGQDADIISGVMWAADSGANVILMAFSSPDFSASLQEAIDYAWSKGVVLVAAAGNDSLAVPAFPAGDRGVMGVTATDPTDHPVLGSNTGASIFIAAPGVNILGTALNSGYLAGSGTSASAAIVAGSAGLMKALNPALTNGMIVNRLAANADPAGTQAETGNGRVQLARAIADTSTGFIQPAGAAPVGGGGPFVGPYKIGSTTVTINSVTGFPMTVDADASGNVTLSVSYNFTVGFAAGTTSTKYSVYLKNGGTTVDLASQTTCPGVGAGTYSGSPSVTLSGAGSATQTWDLHVDTTRCNGTGSSDNKTSSAWVTVNPPPAAGSGSLSVGSQSGTATYGTGGTVTFAVSATRGANGTISGTYAVSGLPAGVTGAFNPTSCDSNGNNPIPGSALTLTVGSTVAAGSHPAFTVTCNALTSATGTLTVAKAPVKAKAGGGSGYFNGTTQSPPACEVTPIAPNTYKGALTCTNDPSSVGPNAGTTTIAPVVNYGTDNSANFDVTTENGSYTINKALVNAKAGGGSGYYNASTQTPSACAVTAIAPSTYVTGLSCSNNPTSVGPDAGTTAISPVMNYGTGNSANFDVTSENGSYTINKALVNAKAGGGSGYYNASTQTPSACAVTAIAPSTYVTGLSCTNDPASVGPNAGTTAIAPVMNYGTGNPANFDVTSENGSYTINKALVKAKAGGGSGYYNASTQTPSACAVTAIAPSTYVTGLSCTNNPASVGPDAGTTAISPVMNYGTGNSENFTVTSEDGSYTINKALVKAKAGSGSGYYNASTQTPSACAVTAIAPSTYVTGLSCTNDPASVGPNAGTTAVAPVMNYGTGNPANFDVTSENGSYTINKALVKAKAGSGSGYYNASTQTPSACAVTAIAPSTYVTGLSCSNNPASVGPDAGTTSISPVMNYGTGNSANFDLTAENGSYTINKALVKATAGSGVGFFDGKLQSPSACAVTAISPSTYVTGLSCTNSPPSVGPASGPYTILPVISYGTDKSTNFTVTNINGVYVIQQDLADCPVAVPMCYNGQRSAWTPTQTSNSATILLSAVITDATLSTPGPITGATITFGVRDLSTDAIRPIPGAVNLPVGLVNPTDPTTGTASASAVFNLGNNALCDAFNIVIMVGGNYRKDTPAWKDTMISVCRAVPGSMTANPPAILSNDESGGYLADSSGNKTTAQFGVQYNKGGANPQGRVTVTVTSDHNSSGVYEKDSKHTYIIASNAISSLNVSGSKADFAAKCNVYEDRNGTLVPLDSGATMQLSLNAATVSSGGQTLGITINKSKSLGGMWFSSKWNGSKTVEKTIDNPVTTGNPPGPTMIVQ